MFEVEKVHYLPRIFHIKGTNVLLLIDETTVLKVVRNCQHITYGSSRIKLFEKARLVKLIFVGVAKAQL